MEVVDSSTVRGSEKEGEEEEYPKAEVRKRPVGGYIVGRVGNETPRLGGKG